MSTSRWPRRSKIRKLASKLLRTIEFSKINPNDNSLLFYNWKTTSLVNPLRKCIKIPAKYTLVYVDLLSLFLFLKTKFLLSPENIANFSAILLSTQLPFFSLSFLLCSCGQIARLLRPLILRYHLFCWIDITSKAGSVFLYVRHTSD